MEEVNVEYVFRREVESMLNKEKYAKEIFEIACNGSAIAVVKGKLVTCVGTSCKDCDFYSKRGRDCIEQCKEWCEAEYVEPQVDWSKVAVDTPILVRDKECYTWKKRYFAKYEEGYVYAWNDGADSWSSNDFASPWRIAKLAEGEQGKPPVVAVPSR